ncbi:SDR family oxidoreductase [Aliicoccus persicus]|uniref:NAD(P)-dependent dehydrogenase, short-chain alcohol dehydrogenase family n=1 Tax=Aliicoccus persicus TaxID=930138 RepID=A0A662Z4T5_9STAP|nr:SDR family oxidoreductase [Aliicoccus persicus]SEW13905.1 NAD(P)-dependent dehydrogenase, short-chain alcohol dehydrogenase family [Aliicoccus persicus]
MKDYLNYSDQTVVITGAASGMGKATAEMLVDLGAKVYTLDYVKKDIPGVEKAFQADISKREDIDDVFKELPSKIDKFFGVAGVSGVKHDFTDTTTINFIANKYMFEEYIADRISDSGAIVFVSSMGAFNWENHLTELKPFINAKGWDETLKVVTDSNKVGKRTGMDGYMLSKRLVNYYALLQAKELSKKEVRINVIMPGGTQTGLTDEFADMVGGDENLQRGLIDRLSTPEEMANAMVFLNSGMATYINGVTLYVNAGHSIPEVINEKPKEFDFPIFR